MRYFIDETGMHPFGAEIDAAKLFEFLTGYDSDAFMNGRDEFNLKLLLNHPTIAFSRQRHDPNGTFASLDIVEEKTCYLGNFAAVKIEEGAIVLGMKYKYTGYLFRYLVVPKHNFDALLRKYFIDEFLTENP